MIQVATSGNLILYKCSCNSVTVLWEKYLQGIFSSLNARPVLRVNTLLKNQIKIIPIKCARTVPTKKLKAAMVIKYCFVLAIGENQ